MAPGRPSGGSVGRRPHPSPVLHLEPIGGMAGDMFLGALIDLGVPPGVVSEAVASLGLAGVGVEVRSARRLGVVGLRFRVLLDGIPLEGPEPDGAWDGPGTDGERPLPAVAGADWDLCGIAGLLRASALPATVRRRAEALFAELARVRAGETDEGPEAVRFTGPAGVDFLVDLVGAAAAVQHLGPARITCGSVNVGGADGRSAASLGLPAGAPLHSAGTGELLTPTGAAILAQVVDEFGPPPPMSAERIGHGLGRRQTAEAPNVVRAVLGHHRERRGRRGTNGRPGSVLWPGGSDR